MSETCPTCPVVVGMEGRIKVCGSPSSECEIFLDTELRTLEAMKRLAGMAKESQNGVFDMAQLVPGDTFTLLSSPTNVPYRVQADRLVTLAATDVQLNGIVHATVIMDTYNDYPPDHIARLFAIPESEEITVHGSTDLGDDKFPGVLKVGSLVDHTSSRGRWRGIGLQEVVVASGIAEVQAPMFGTDLSVYRGAPDKN